VSGAPAQLASDLLLYAGQAALGELPRRNHSFFSTRFWGRVTHFS
jgi:hypothetical protein